MIIIFIFGNERVRHELFQALDQRLRGVRCGVPDQELRGASDGRRSGRASLPAKRPKEPDLHQEVHCEEVEQLCANQVRTYATIHLGRATIMDNVKGNHEHTKI